MDIRTIDGALYAKMLLGGAAVLSAHTDELNSLNVFPVSDGDTGSNMMKTVEGGLAEISRGDTETGIDGISSRFANGALLGARGNSGVILSQIFAGISKGLAGHEKADALTLAKAYELGIESSYSAVQHPVEGTILTVFRESAEYALQMLDESSSVTEFYSFHVEKARQSLAKTPELLDALKEANVVDSGAAGYLYIAEGMSDILEGKEHSAVLSSGPKENTVDISRFRRDSVLEFGYCTEFLLRLTDAKVNPDSFDIKTVLSDLEALGGESVVAYKQDDTVKVHVHTFYPGRILAKMQDYGEFLTVKVENMMLGHEETVVKSKKENKPYAVVAAASGEGIAKIFEELGADAVIMWESPSAEDFLTAYRKCENGRIIVLPNHKNSFLVAKQAAAMMPECDIRVIETKSCMQGYSAISVLTPGITDTDALEESAKRAAESVIDGDVAQAVKDAEIGGFSVKKGDFIARTCGNMVAVEKTAENALLKLLENTDTDLCELITVFTGKNITAEDIDYITEKINGIYPDCELTVKNGGQEIYDYLIALE
ncbi:MAG: DAK2 domain-containing protein [Clostridia bacterium]|nr:DAK2 domain-containing protein [Clostridia bacterium]